MVNLGIPWISNLFTEEIGHAAGFTSRRPLTTIAIVYAERDGADAKLHNKALKQFISG
jgi:hypothetical protein